jgi:hypothetical protein
MAVSDTLLTIIWQLLSDPEARLDGLWPDFYGLHIDLNAEPAASSTSLTASGR